MCVAVALALSLHVRFEMSLYKVRCLGESVGNLYSLFVNVLFSVQHIAVKYIYGSSFKR